MLADSPGRGGSTRVRHPHTNNLGVRKLMATFSLDDIKAAAEAKYGSTDIDGCELLNPLRLPKKKRDALMDLQHELDKDGADQETLLADAIRLVAASKTKAEKLIEAIDGDLA